MLKLAAAQVDLERGRVWRAAGDEVSLTTTERSLLAWLAAHPGVDHPRSTLLQEVWGYGRRVVSRALDTAVKTLRRKIEADPKNPDHLLTVWGVGYRFEPLRHAGEPDDLVGRSQELAELYQRLSDARLVTVWGPGGAGKTRLAEAVAADIDGAVLVHAAQARDRSELETLTSLALTDDGGLQQAMARCPLLVLDNLEQLGDDAAGAVHDWLEASPSLRILTTSRRALGLDGESLLALGPLEREAGVELLRRRLHSTLPSPTSADEVLLAELVEMLDGLPLALELAAARALVLDLGELVARLDQPGVLQQREGELRHRSADALIGWSWDLLEPPVRTALADLALFVGTFHLADAEAVLGPDALDVVQQLMEASLVVRRPDGLRLLAVVSHFARCRPGSPDAPARHARWALQSDPEDLQERRRHAPELMAALTRDLPPALEARTCLALAALYRTSGPARERVPLTDAAIDAARRSADHVLLARAWLARAAAGIAGGDATIELLQVALGHALRVGAADLVVEALAMIAASYRARGHLQLAHRCCLDGLSLAEAEGVDTPLVATLLGEVGLLERLLGRPRDAIPRFEAAASRLLALGDPRGAAQMMQRLGVTCRTLGELDQGRLWLERALQLADAHEVPWAQVSVRGGLAEIELDQGHPGAALAYLQQCELLLGDGGMPFFQALLHSAKSQVHLELEQPVAAMEAAARGVEAARSAGAAQQTAEVVLADAVIAVHLLPRDAALRRLDDAVAQGEIYHQDQHQLIALAYRAAVGPDPLSDLARAEVLAASTRAVLGEILVELLAAAHAGGPPADPDRVAQWFHARRVRALLVG